MSWWRRLVDRIRGTHQNNPDPVNENSFGLPVAAYPVVQPPPPMQQYQLSAVDRLYNIPPPYLPPPPVAPLVLPAAIPPVSDALEQPLHLQQSPYGAVHYDVGFSGLPVSGLSSRQVLGEVARPQEGGGSGALPLQQPGAQPEAAHAGCLLPAVCPAAREDLFEQAIISYIQQRHRELGVNIQINPVEISQDPIDPKKEVKKISKELTKHDRAILADLTAKQFALAAIAEAFFSVRRFTVHANFALPSAQFCFALVYIFLYFFYDKSRNFDSDAQSKVGKWWSRPLSKYGFALLVLSIISLGLNFTVVGMEDFRTDTVNGEEVIGYNRVHPVLIALNLFFLFPCVVLPFAVESLAKRFDLFAADEYIAELKDNIEKLNQDLKIAEANLLRAQYATKNVRSELFFEVIRLNQLLQAKVKDNKSLRVRLIQLYHLIGATHHCAHPYGPLRAVSSSDLRNRHHEHQVIIIPADNPEGSLGTAEPAQAPPAGQTERRSSRWSPRIVP